MLQILAPKTMTSTCSMSSQRPSTTSPILGDLSREVKNMYEAGVPNLPVNCALNIHYSTVLMYHTTEYISSSIEIEINNNKTTAPFEFEEYHSGSNGQIAATTTLKATNMHQQTIVKATASVALHGKYIAENLLGSQSGEGAVVQTTLFGRTFVSSGHRHGMASATRATIGEDVSDVKPPTALKSHKANVEISPAPAAKDEVSYTYTLIYILIYIKVHTLLNK